MRSTAVLLAFAFVTAASSLHGQQPASPAATSPDYSAESIVVEQLNTIHRFAADGTGSREISAVIRIQSDAAARQYGVLNFPFAGNSEHVELDYVRAVKPDGAVVETPAADALELPQEVTRQAPFYSDLKEKQVPVRNLRMGDKLEYKVRIITTTAEDPGQFWGQDTFGLWAVILKENVELHVPKAKYVKVWSPTSTPARADSGDEAVYRWTGSQLIPTAPKDSPLKHRELDPKGELPTIAWTTFKSWEEVGAWYRSLEADRILPDAAVKAKAAEITAGKTTDEDKARALYAYVATQIRYIGVAFGVGRYQPHPAAEVLRNQYGDCKDKHTLLAALMAASGLKPSAVLIGAGIRLNDDVPSPSAFNHLITTLPLGGQPIWLDTTAEVAPWNMLTLPTRDKQALVIPDAGPAKLERTPLTLPFKAFGTFTAKGTLSKEGTMKAQIEYLTRGDNEIFLRALLRQVAPGQWDELSQTISQGLGFSGTTSHTEAGRPDKTDEPARIAYDYEREKTGDWDNHRIIALLPVVYLTSVDDKYPPQKYPLQLGEPRVETSLSVIKLPAGWGATLPDAVHQKIAYATFDKTYKIEGDTLTTERRLEILQREVPASDWKAYKKWYDDALGEGEPFITLIPTESKMLLESDHPQQVALIKQFYEQIERGEAQAASNTSTTMINHWPDSIWTYRSILALDLMRGESEKALPIARTILTHNDATGDDRLRILKLFERTDHYDEASPVVEKLSEEKPDDVNLKLRLGIAQMRSRQAEKGIATLTSVISQTSDLSALNNAAHELVNAGTALDLVEKSCRTAVEILTPKTLTWTLPKLPIDQQEVQELLLATWSTLGWTLLREGKLDEAETYLKAAWLNTPSSESASHLGELEEKQGNLQRAMAIYQMGLAAERASIDESPSQGEDTDPFTTILRSQLKELAKRNIKAPSFDAGAELKQQNVLELGPGPQRVRLQDYHLLISETMIIEAAPDTSESSSSTPSLNRAAFVKRATPAGWVPTGSTAHLVRWGALSCDNGTCELIIDRE